MARVNSLFMWMAAALVAVTASSMARAQGYVCAEGGGNANKGDWTDEVFGWMVEKGGRGHVVIIGALEVDPDDNRAELFKRLGAASASNIRVDQTNADSPEVIAEISRASVVWIKGGDQGRYFNWWRGTGTERAIKGVFEKGGVVGGTSAGCAVLGEVTYDARRDGLSPRDAIRDALHTNLTLTADFLGLAPGVLFDTHFTERGRLGRLPVMLAHARESLSREVIGVGVDPRTAVCISPDGVAQVLGEGAVTIVRMEKDARAELSAGRPPSIGSMRLDRLVRGHTFDARTGAVRSRPDWVREARPAGPASWESLFSRPTIVELAGDAPIDALDVYITSDLTPDAGAEPMGVSVTQLPLVAARRRAWESGHVWDRHAQVFEALSTEPGATGLLLDELARVSIGDRGMMTVDGEVSALVIETRHVTHAGRVDARTTAIENARLFVLAPGESRDLSGGIVVQAEEDK